MLWINNFNVSDNRIIKWFELIVERRLGIIFELLKCHLLIKKWKCTNESVLLFRPYLMCDINEEWINNLKMMKSEFNLYDGYFDNVCCFNPKLKDTNYTHINVIDSKNKDLYYGYRQTWHMLTYADKAYRNKLLEHWGVNRYDCTFDAFCDYHKLVTGEDLEDYPVEKAASLVFKCD